MHLNISFGVPEPDSPNLNDFFYNKVRSDQQHNNTPHVVRYNPQVLADIPRNVTN